MKQHSVIQQHIEILPDAWLPHRHRWQRVARSVPTGGCLLVTDPRNPRLAALMGKLARLFRAAGRAVVIWQPLKDCQAAERQSGGATAKITDD